MNIYEEYNYYVGFLHYLKEKLYNAGYVYDEKHGWYNYYNRPLKKKEKEEIDELLKKFKFVNGHITELNKIIDK